MFIRLAALLIVSASMSAHAKLDLKQRNPNEPVEYTLNTRFSLESALTSSRQIRSFLDSFQTLTRMAKEKFSAAELKAVGNTDWDMQHLGFPNHTNAIEGTLLKQEYFIKKLEFELAQEKLKSGKAESKAAAAAEKDFQKAEKAFQMFWDKFGVAD